MAQHIKLPTSSHSFWMVSTPETHYPQLQENIKVDVVIIGGGMTGITAAYMLVKQGLKVALLEADKILQGTTAHTTAKLTSQHNLIYTSIKGQYGRELAEQYAAANEKAIQIVADILKEHNIDANYRQQPAYVYTFEDKYIKQIEDEVNTARDLGIKAHYLDSIPLGFSIKAAMRFDGQAQFHPLKYLKPLAKWVTENGGMIYEQTPAVNLIHENGSDLVETRGGHRVEADKIVVATHYPFFDGGSMYFAKMYQERAYVLAIKIREQFPEGMYITAESPSRSLRSLPTEDGDLVMVIGDSHRTGSGQDTEQHYQNLLKFAEEHYTINEVCYRWSTQDCTTPDNIPYVGNLTAKSPNIYVATGFYKWGMTNSTAAAKIISDLIVIGDNPWAQVYSPSRGASLKVIGAVIKHNIKVAADYFGGKLSAGEYGTDLTAGEAKIIDKDGARMGAYKDEQGQVHLVDCTCTHLGCELSWNSSEKTWDCPCHGSRYSYEGEVVDGPTFMKLSHDAEDPNRVEARVFS
ncbi:MAG: FAD-dependent oxidoreductase [Methylocystaceae bacterium]